jgi:hypothetical protein
MWPPTAPAAPPITAPFCVFVALQPMIKKPMTGIAKNIFRIDFIIVFLVRFLHFKHCTNKKIKKTVNG